MITCAVRTFQLVGLAMIWLVSVPLIAVSQDDQASLTYYISSAKSYLTEDGLIDRCVQSAFLTYDGRLNIIPCFHAQAAHEVYMYQYDGFRSYKQRPHVLPDSGQWSIVATDINQESIAYGYLLEYSNEETPLFRYFSLGTREVTWNVLDPPKHEGQYVHIRSVKEYNGDVYMLGQLPDQIFVYKLGPDEEWEFRTRIDAPGAVGNLRYPMAFEIENDVVWTEAWNGTVYRIEMPSGATTSIRGVEIKNELRTHTNQFVRMPDGAMLYSMQNISTIYEVDTVNQILKQYTPRFMRGSISDEEGLIAHKDEKGNILMLRYTLDGLEGWLVDTRGVVHVYTPALKNFDGLTLSRFQRKSFASTDFKSRYFHLGQNFGAVEVTSREFVQAVPGGPMRGYIKTGPDELTVKVANDLTSYFNGDEIKSRPLEENSCLRYWYSDGSVFRFDKDRFGFGSRSNGAWIYDLRMDTCRRISPEAQVVRISNLHFDSIVYLVNDQLAMFSFTTGEYKTLADTIFDSFVNQIYISKVGGVYMGSADGLYKLDADNRRLQYVHLGGRQDEQQVLSIFEDVYGQLWIGTYGQGLKIYNPETGDIRHISVDEGLSSNIVASTVADGDGDIWVGTFSGITMYDKDANLLGYLNEEGGLVDNECNRWSAFLMEDGKMFFGTPVGFSIIDAAGIKSKLRDSVLRKIYMTRLEFDGTRLAVGDDDFEDILTSGIEIPADDRSVRVSYGLSNYAAPQSNNYAYRFDRPGAEWNYVGGLHDLALSNLAHGEYDLLIKGSDALGRSSANVLRVPLRVQRYFFQSWWFYVLCSIPFVAFAALWAQRQRLERARLEEEVAKRTETIRSQTDELRELDRMKTRLYTNITHEFRTPLTVIQGLAGQASEDPEAEKLIRRNADNLLNLVNQMLDLRKLESGSLKLHLQQSDLIRYLSYIGESIRSLAEIRHHQFHFLAPTVPLVMDFDREKLTRVITNLLSNAIKFTPEGGDIYLQVEEVRPGSSQVTIKITDTGVGIPADKIGHIFERFYQIDDSTTRRGEGTGIGLTLVKELVDLMGGTIGVQSKPGSRTTFSVTLPIENEAPLAESSIDYPEILLTGIPQGREQKQEQVQGNLPLVLIVEDNPDVLHYIGSCLQEDYQIAIALNGEEGIEKAIELVPDIVISDVMMPVKNGFELCQTLKEDVRTSHIPVILLTAKADAESRLFGLERGADAYLSKPFDERELLIRVRQMLQLRERLRQRYSDGTINDVSDDPAIVQEDAFIVRFREALLEHLGDQDFGVSEISGALHLSRTQVHKKITALTGKSASLFMRSIRLKEATTLLRDNSELTISEIAYQVGFKDPKYFARVFKEEFGTTPTALREEMNINPPGET